MKHKHDKIPFIPIHKLLISVSDREKCLEKFKNNGNLKEVHAEAESLEDPAYVECISLYFSINNTINDCIRDINIFLKL